MMDFSIVSCSIVKIQLKDRFFEALNYHPQFIFSTSFLVRSESNEYDIHVDSKVNL